MNNFQFFRLFNVIFLSSVADSDSARSESYIYQQIGDGRGVFSVGSGALSKVGSAVRAGGVRALQLHCTNDDYET